MACRKFEIAKETLGDFINNKKSFTLEESLVRF
jgi:hypothetical protein